MILHITVLLYLLICVQGKGRARAKPSLHVMMREAGDWKYADEIEAYRDIEDSAIDLCHEEFEAELTDEDGDEVEVYLSDPRNPESSPRVDSLKAVGTVHRYVQSLPTDRFTDLQPYWDLESKVSIILIQNSKNLISLTAIPTD